MKPSMTAAEVARVVFRRDHPDWFYRHRKRLESDHGFPPPLGGIGELLYDPDKVQAWRQGRIDARGTRLVPRTATPQPDDTAGEDLDAAEAELRARIPAVVSGVEGAE